MRNPIEYNTTPFHGLNIMVVDPGTVIKDERTEREETVTENSAVQKGSVVYCTQKTFDALKAQSKPAQ